MNDLLLTVSDLPPFQPGIFFYGPFQAQVGSGNGWLCVGGMVVRVLPAQVPGPSGQIVLPIDLLGPPYNAGQGAILPGSTWNFQFWYRDPAGGLFPWNFSNAAQIVFAH